MLNSDRSLHSGSIIGPAGSLRGGPPVVDDHASPEEAAEDVPFRFSSASVESSTHHMLGNRVPSLASSVDGDISLHLSSHNSQSGAMLQQHLADDRHEAVLARDQIVEPTIDVSARYAFKTWSLELFDNILLLFGGYGSEETERNFASRQFLNGWSVPLSTAALGVSQVIAVALSFEAVQNRFWSLAVLAVLLASSVVSTWYQWRIVSQMVKLHQDHLRSHAGRTSSEGLAYTLILSAAPFEESVTSRLEMITIAQGVITIMCHIVLAIVTHSPGGVIANGTGPISVVYVMFPVTLFGLCSRIRFNRFIGIVFFSFAASLIASHIAGESLAFALEREHLSVSLLWLFGLLLVVGAKEDTAREHFRRISVVGSSMHTLQVLTRNSRTLLEDMVPAPVLGRLLRGAPVHDASKEVSTVCIDFCSSVSRMMNNRSEFDGVAALTALIKDLDAECRRHKIDKATSSGDAFWGTCGLADSSVALQHALKMTNFALAVIVWHPYRDVLLRIGLHSGPMASTIFGTTLDVVGAGMNITREIAGATAAGTILATDAFLVCLSRQVGPSVMEKYSTPTAFWRLQLQCTKLPVRVVTIEQSILDGESVSPLLEMHGSPIGNDVGWFFDEQINPSLTSANQAVYLLRQLRSRQFRILNELGLNRRLRNHLPEEEQDAHLSSAISNPLAAATMRKEGPSHAEVTAETNTLHYFTYRPTRMLSAIALLCHAAILLLLIMLSNAPQRIDSVALVCLSVVAVGGGCHALITQHTPLLGGILSNALFAAGGVFALAGLMICDAKSVRGNLTHTSLLYAALWPSVSSFRLRLFSAASSALVAVAGITFIGLTHDDITKVPSFFFFSFAVIVPAAALSWLDHYHRSRQLVIEEQCLTLCTKVTERSRIVLHSLLCMLIPRYLVDVFLDRYDLTAVKQPLILIDESTFIFARRCAAPVPSLINILPSFPTYRWHQMAIGVLLINDLMSAQQVLATDLFNQISQVHQWVNAAISSCRTLTILKASGDLIVVGGPISFNVENAGKDDALSQVIPDDPQSRLALLQLLFVANSRRLRHRRGISMRAGMHIGPVCGTILGSSKLTFELVGNTITTVTRIGRFAPRERPMASEVFAAAYERALADYRRDIARFASKESADSSDSDEGLFVDSTEFSPVCVEWGSPVVVQQDGPSLGPQIMAVELITTTPLTMR